MPVELLTPLFFGSLLFFVLLGTPLAFVLGGISVVFLWFEMGPVGFYLLSSKMWETMSNATLMAIPLFVFMATLLEKSGVAEDLYDMMHKWWGGVRGGVRWWRKFSCARWSLDAAPTYRLSRRESGR